MRKYLLQCLFHDAFRSEVDYLEEINQADLATMYFSQFTWTSLRDFIQALGEYNDSLFLSILKHRCGSAYPGVDADIFTVTRSLLFARSL